MGLDHPIQMNLFQTAFLLNLFPDDFFSTLMISLPLLHFYSPIYDPSPSKLSFNSELGTVAHTAPTPLLFTP